MSLRHDYKPASHMELSRYRIVLHEIIQIYMHQGGVKMAPKYYFCEYQLT